MVLGVLLFRSPCASRCFLAQALKQPSYSLTFAYMSAYIKSHDRQTYIKHTLQHHGSIHMEPRQYVIVLVYCKWEWLFLPIWFAAKE